MNAADLVHRAFRQGIQLWVEEGRVRYRAPDTQAARKTLADLVVHRDDIIEMLESDPWQGKDEVFVSFEEAEEWLARHGLGAEYSWPDHESHPIMKVSFRRPV